MLCGVRDWRTCCLDCLESSQNTNVSTKLVKLGQCVFLSRGVTNIIGCRMRDGRKTLVADGKAVEKRAMRGMHGKKVSMGDYDTVASTFSP